MNTKHAGRIETRDSSLLWFKLAGHPKRVRTNSAILHIGKHGVYYARGRNAR